MLTRRATLKTGLATIGSLAFFTPYHASLAETKTLPAASWKKLPKWKGFNLLEKFMVPWNNGPFDENNFRWISELGFHFVRLPMDYRTWIVDKDWRRLNENVLREIDDAVNYGEKYGIHVNINFHRAPGYTVAKPPEERSVWSDAEAQEVCALHWATFAKRYKRFSNEQVSFNLFNEPATVEPSVYFAVHKKIIDAIRAEDPNRLIICDGTSYGSKPFLPLTQLQVAQATRGYAPSEISHYKASWVNSENFPEPRWPMHSINGLLLCASKSEIPADEKQPLEIEGLFPFRTKLRLRVSTVSNRSRLIVEADGQTIFEHQFAPGDGEGEWKKVVFRPEWNVYQNIYDRDYETTIPAGTKLVRISTASGDWISLSQIGFKNEKTPKELCVEATNGWGQKSSKLKYTQTGDEPASVSGGETRDRAWLKRTMIAPWKKLEETGAGIMVGEFGAFNKTPHDVTLRWLSDSIANWNEAGWGFALWNFRGSFGIIDSERTDVEYENFHGHKLDRKMLELLR